MGWKQRGQRQYYYRSRRIRDRVTTEYVGAGDRALLLSECDACDQEQRAATRRARAALTDLATPPAELGAYAATVRTAVEQVLASLGFHQHKRQWRYKRMAEPFDHALAIYRKPQPSDAEIAELRRLVNEHTQVAQLGDVAALAERMFLAGFREQPALKAAIDARGHLLRKQLGWADSTELERMLINEVILTWIDYYRLVAVHAQEVEINLNVTEQWDRVLTSKQRRYLRAIETLARVRRLLRLPSVQVNVDARQLTITDGVR